MSLPDGGWAGMRATRQTCTFCLAGSILQVAGIRVTLEHGMRAEHFKSNRDLNSLPPLLLLPGARWAASASSPDLRCRERKRRVGRTH